MQCERDRRRTSRPHWSKRKMMLVSSQPLRCGRSIEKPPAESALCRWTGLATGNRRINVWQVLTQYLETLILLITWPMRTHEYILTEKVTQHPVKQDADRKNISVIQNQSLSVYIAFSIPKPLEEQCR